MTKRWRVVGMTIGALGFGLFLATVILSYKYGWGADGYLFSGILLGVSLGMGLPRG